MPKRRRHYTDRLEVEKYIDYLKKKIKSLKHKLKKVGKDESNAN